MTAAKGKDRAENIEQTSHQHYGESGEDQQESRHASSLKAPTNIYYFKDRAHGERELNKAHLLRGRGERWHTKYPQGSQQVATRKHKKNMPPIVSASPWRAILWRKGSRALLTQVSFREVKERWANTRATFKETVLWQQERRQSQGCKTWKATLASHHYTPQEPLDTGITNTNLTEMWGRKMEHGQQLNRDSIF